MMQPAVDEDGYGLLLMSDRMFMKCSHSLFESSMARWPLETNLLSLPIFPS